MTEEQFRKELFRAIEEFLKEHGKDFDELPDGVDLFIHFLVKRYTRK